MTLRKLNREEAVEIDVGLDEIHGGHNPCTGGSTYEDICPVRENRRAMQARTVITNGRKPEMQSRN